MANYTTNFNLYRPNKADNDINVSPSLDTNFTTIDTEISEREKAEMFPNLNVIKIDGMTVGNIVLVRSLVVLGTITLA